MSSRRINAAGQDTASINPVVVSEGVNIGAMRSLQPVVGTGCVNPAEGADDSSGSLCSPLTSSPERDSPVSAPAVDSDPSFSPGPSGSGTTDVLNVPASSMDSSPSRSSLSAEGVDDGSRSVRSLLTPSAKQDLFTQQVMAAYEIVIGWRRNLFIVPHGAVGASFVNELAGLIEGFAEGSDVRNVAWRAVAVA